MRILWVVAPVLPQIAALTGSPEQYAGGWLVSVCDGLLADEANELTVCYRAEGPLQHGSAGRLSYRSFEQPTLRYAPETERLFAGVLASEKPDVIHIWGTEYPFTLAMLNACERAGALDRAVVSIQGLCSVCARHYTAGLPERAVNACTFRDFVRRDSIRRQREKYAMRGAFEIEALKKARHVIGRTDWDRACVRQINPAAAYHFCGETLRAPFYEGIWTPKECAQHTIFVAQGNYPIKGLHKAIEALSILKKEFPDVRLITTGADPRDGSTPEKRLRRTCYAKYLARLIRENGLDDAVSFAGSLRAERMREAYLSANVALSPSSIENSSNAIGEAMLLGTPVVASFTGGTANLLTHGEDGFLYPFDAPYLLAEYARRIFLDDELALRLSKSARAHARRTHDPAKNLADLIAIYARVAETAGEDG